MGTRLESLFNSRLALSLSTLTAIAALALTTTGCDKAKQAINKAKAAGGKVSDMADKAKNVSRKADPERRAIAAASKKMNAYAACLNGFGANVRRARNYYLRWADPETGPTGKERNIHGIHKVNLDPESRCAAKVAKVAKSQPAMPELESAGETFIEALRTATKVINDAYAYYKPKAYTGDGMAKGKAMHPKLMAAFEAFAKADAALGQQFDREDDALAQRRLRHLAKSEGKKMRYRHLLHMQHAKQLVRAVRTERPMDLSDLDLGALKSAIAAYQRSLKDASNYARGHKKEFPTASSYSRVAKTGEAFLKAARKVSLRKSTGKVFTGKEPQLRSGNPKRLPGHPAHVVATYNDLIRDSNSLRL